MYLSLLYFIIWGLLPSCALLHCQICIPFSKRRNLMLLIIIEDIAQRHEDMNFIFDWWKQYFFMKELSECHNSAVHHGAHRILCHL